MSMDKLVSRAGESWVYTTFTEGVRDDYDDVSYTASASTIRGVRSDRGDRTYLSQTGEARLVDVNVLVSYPVENVNGDLVSIEDVTTTRAATLTDTAGRIYQVVGVGHEAQVRLGMIRLMCSRQADA